MSDADQALGGALDDPNLSDPIAPQPPPPKATGNSGRKRLATLCGAFLLLIGLIGYLYWSMVHDEHTTAEIQKELKAEGVDMVFSQAEPKESASFSPFQSLTPTVRIVAPHGNVTDATLQRIRQINLDMGLMLNNCPVTDEGLAALEGKQNLRWLELRKTKITDEGLKHLRGTDLELLDLTSTNIDDAGLANLAELDLPNLKTLVLEGLPHVTDQGIAHLSGFKKLEFLTIGGTKVTTPGKKHLKAKIPEITILGGS
jgi:Leucine Rich repeat